MATRTYDVVIVEKVQTHYRIEASSGQEASFLIGGVHGADQLPEGVTHIRTRITGTKVTAAPTVGPDQHTFPLDDDDEHQTQMDTVGADVAQAVHDAEQVNSGETVIGAPVQKRAAR